MYALLFAIVLMSPGLPGRGPDTCYVFEPGHGPETDAAPQAIETHCTGMDTGEDLMPARTVERGSYAADAETKKDRR
jgi:hypothetical protein